MAEADPARLNRHWNCRITTRGRRSGKPRTTTIWFVLQDGTVFLTGGKDNPQWCRNIRAHEHVCIEIAGTRLEGRARIVEDPAGAAKVRDLFPRKYWLARMARWFGGYTRSVPVVVELDGSRMAPEG
jgi:deazaflavin-dependent oxidoreductase (nitroreductase family)